MKEKEICLENRIRTFYGKDEGAERTMYELRLKLMQCGECKSYVAFGQGHYCLVKK